VLYRESTKILAQPDMPPSQGDGWVQPAMPGLLSLEAPAHVLIAWLSTSPDRGLRTRRAKSLRRTSGSPGADRARRSRPDRRRTDERRFGGHAAGDV